MARPRPRRRWALPALAAAACACPLRRHLGFLAPKWGRGLAAGPALGAAPVLLLAPAAPASAAAEIVGYEGGVFVQICLVLAAVVVAVGFITFNKPEQEEWQKELDEELSREEWVRSDGPYL
eukprot:CAMPEP_0204576424 /NCGR_PEP_ID=MMETSP0661-20131031/41765_1 /ASSEMBLY_ACC=CAM_ASM_000606 /TAXON_ID=109239 /ORGANISM="Alexandrium margalefi, Strain AMGDE01CS-322" /LENGTH=121 /DNA_ID=CAMNT_0051585171 /DNA_START=31 /DNA_END=396 /DNA_ORIENTATION=+